MNDSKKIPQSLESEEAVLGAILLNNKVMLSIASKLKSKHFYQQRNALIYQTAYDMWASNEPIDILTIQERLKTKGFYDPVYIDQLYDRVPSSHNAPTYAQRIIETYRQRELSNLFCTGYQESINTENINETIGKYKNCLHIVTTHYTKLYRIEKKKETGFKNIKFSVLIKDDNILFPYKLERGYSRQFVALKLMRQKNLNDEFLNKAIKLIV